MSKDIYQQAYPLLIRYFKWLGSKDARIRNNTPRDSTSAWGSDA